MHTYVSRIVVQNGLVQHIEKKPITADDLPRPANIQAGGFFLPYIAVNQQGQIVQASGLPTPTGTTTYYSLTIAPDGTVTGSTTPPVSGGSERLATYTSTVNADTTETDLFTTTLAAGQLAANGDLIEGVYQGEIVASTPFHRLRAYFGGTMFYDSTSFQVDAATPWNIRVSVIRTSSSTVRLTAALAAYVDYKLLAATFVEEITGLTLANTQVMKLTGETNTTLGDMTGTAGYLIYHPA